MLIKLRSETVNKVPHVYVCVCARRFCFWQCALSLRDVLSQGCSAVHTFPVDEAFNCEPVIIRFMFKLIFLL